MRTGEFNSLRRRHTASSLTVHLYGVEQNKNDHGLNGKGIACRSPVQGDSFCGIPPALWDSNPSPTPDSCTRASKTDAKTLPGGVDDCFYRYGALPFDNGDLNAFFGYKGLKLDSAGNVWTLNFGTGTLGVLVAGCNSITCDGLNFDPLGADLNSPSGITVDAAGNIWIANAGGNSISEFIGLAAPTGVPVACLKAGQSESCLP